MTLTPLIEYLLGITRKGGGKLCRLGIVQITVPIFPANTTITYTTEPYFSAYANIWFWWRLSPAMVPGAFNVNIRHSGMPRALGLLGATALTLPGYQIWLDVRRGDPIVNEVTNISGVGQWFESQDFFLIVDTEDDLKKVQAISREWGRHEGVEL